MLKLKPLIVALDVDDINKALMLIDEVHEYADIVKINHSLYLRNGDRIIEKIHQKKKKIFLDLKFHDIPNTVESAVKAAAELGVFAVSVHLSGGLSMLNRIIALKKRPLIWGVTVLTSIDEPELSTIGYSLPMPEQIKKLAYIGIAAGVDGIVCSPHDICRLKQYFIKAKKNVTLITPGIRLNARKHDDQKRVASPRQAMKNGADFIVVGRPIIAADDPRIAAKNIYEEII